MLPVTSLPENSNDSAGSSEMMSSICLAMTTVSLGVAAMAGPASRTVAASNQVIAFMQGLLSMGRHRDRDGRLTHDRGGTTACQARPARQTHPVALGAATSGSVHPPNLGSHQDRWASAAAEHTRARGLGVEFVPCLLHG